MTWTKLSDDFSDHCSELSDAAFRTHVEGLLWTMRRETGGFIASRDVKRFTESPHAEAAIAELVACGWWSIERQGYRINHHMEHQPEPALIAKRRDLTAERVRRHRFKKAGMPSSNAVSECVTRDGTGRGGAGKTTTHQEEEQRQPGNAPTRCSWCQGTGCPNCLPDESFADRTADERTTR